MQILSVNIRRVFVSGALAGLVAATLAVPTANAEAECTAAGLSNALGSVGAQTGGYLASHPGANDAITNAGTAPDPEGAIRAYFITHPGEWADLQRIAQPLRTLRQQCSAQVAPTDIARLFDAMAG